MVLPILFGGLALCLIYWVDMWPDLTSFKRSAYTMGALILGYKAPDLFVNNMRQKRTDAIRKGLPASLDLLVICAEAGLTVARSEERRLGKEWDSTSKYVGSPVYYNKNKYETNHNTQ